MEMHGDWNGVIEYRRKIVDLLTDPLEKWKVLISIGDAYREKLNDPEQAVAAYHEALDVQPYSKSALVKLLEIHIKSEAFGEAINVLQHLINIEENAQKKASFTFTIATIYRQHLNEPDASLEYYEQTLDLNAEKLEAFRAVDEVLTQKKAWEELEKAYRRMVNRVRGKGMKEIELTLYRGLGEIYRSRLKKLDLATSSFEMAVKLKMDDVHLHEILAQLYEVQGQREKAIAEHRALVILEPERVESYRRMAATFQEMGLPDDAWFATSVLAIFGRATTEERLAYQELKPTTLVPSTRSLDARLWVRTVFSKAQEVALGDIFQTLYQAVGPYLEGRDPKELGLRRKDEVDLREKTVFSTVLNRVSHLLGIPGPRVYLSERTFGIHVENTIPPVIVIGKDMMSGKSEIELAFQTGKCLAFFHPMHILAACYPAPVLKMFFQVALKYVHPDAVVEGGETEQFRQAAEMLSKRISPQFANALANDVDHYYKKQRKPSVSKWLTGVELTANHAGLLAAMDLEAAVSLLKGESIAISKLAPKEKVKELVLYAVSEEFAQARQALGLKL
jgi:tetratricopeptide (TPR) repeat protein